MPGENAIGALKRRNKDVLETLRSEKANKELEKGRAQWTSATQVSMANDAKKNVVWVKGKRKQAAKDKNQSLGQEYITYCNVPDAYNDKRGNQ